jgi:hypothetical protein
MRAKLLALAAAVGMILGANAIAHSQSPDVPGQRAQGAGASGAAPGHRDTTGAGDQDDRMNQVLDDWMRNHGTMGAGDRDDRPRRDHDDLLRRDDDR